MQLEEILLGNEVENEDNFNLSGSMDNFMRVNIDLASLGVLD